MVAASPERKPHINSKRFMRPSKRRYSPVVHISVVSPPTLLGISLVVADVPASYNGSRMPLTDCGCGKVCGTKGTTTETSD